MVISPRPEAAASSTKVKDDEMNMLTSLFRRSERRRALADLSRLDDHLLRDIGVTRSDVHELMRGARTAHGKARPTHE